MYLDIYIENEISIEVDTFERDIQNKIDWSMIVACDNLQLEKFVYFVSYEIQRTD